MQASLVHSRVAALPSLKRQGASRSSARPSKTNVARVVRATAQKFEQDGLVQFANNIGLPTSEGLFGFKPFSELWTGRLAMMGFIVSIVEEAMTGRGTLAQIGFTTPNDTVLYAILAASVGGSLVGLASTISRATSGKMSRAEINRYRSFLQMTNEDDYKKEAARMKSQGDFTSPDNLKAIMEARSQATAADRFLTIDTSDADKTADDMKAQASILTLEPSAKELAEVDTAAADLKARAANAANPSLPLDSARDAQEALAFTNSDLAYAQAIELRNGRWAMIGFLSAIGVEAVTGQGIIGQLIMWLKFSGLLGEASGF